MSHTVEKIRDPIKAPFEDIVGKLVDGDPQGELFAIPKLYPRSPLRYPGGKSKAIKAIFPIIPHDTQSLCSPFLGGASLELVCTTKMNVYGYDIFEPLVTFWRVLMAKPNELVEAVQKYFPELTSTQFYSLQKRYEKLTDEVEKAAAFYVLNRASFSGTTLSGGMSPDHPRFTQSSIDRLKDFRVNNFEVGCEDFKTVIPKHENDFLYCDPPYMNGQGLYGMDGNTHIGFDHNALAKLLKKRDRWILSYNDCKIVRELYKDNQILSVEWIYGMSKDKKSNEVVILSNDLRIAA